VHLLARRREAIRAALAAAHAAARAAGELPALALPSFALEEPRGGAHGDLACNLALLLGKAAGLAPRDVAAALLAQLPPGSVPDLERAEIAGPGFLNFHLRPGWLGAAVDEALAAGPRYGCSEAGAGRRVLVEFVSANPTGPLNVVNCRAAAFGDALVRCLRAAAYAAEAEYYVNDAGGQFRKLGASLEARLRQRRGEAAEIPEGGYPGEYLLEVAEAYAAEHGSAILEAPPQQRGEALGRFAVQRLLEGQLRDLERFGVRYDHLTYESAIRAAGGPEAVVEGLVAAGRTAERDGALWLLTAGHGDNDDRVLRKGDGDFTYRVPDIAYHVDKFRRGYALLIDIVGQDHHGDLPGVRLGLQWLGLPVDRLQVLITQLIRLVRDGQDAGRVSKRGGNFIAMREFLDEVGVDAARFFFLMRTIENHMEFDVDLARRRSQENPVYYVQYAHARICSILRQAGAQDAGGPAATGLLIHPAEQALCRSLAALPDEVLAAAEGRAPHRLTIYARTVAEHFHTFYVQCRVLGEAPEVTAARLALCRATQIVLRNVLELLGVSAPEQM